MSTGHKTNKRLVWALLASVGLNLFLLGFLVARRPTKSHHTWQDGAGLFRAHEVFGKEGPKEAKELLKRHRAELRPHRRALRQARRDVRKALEAETFDEQSLRTSLQALRSQVQGMQRGMHEALIELARTMDWEQRKRLARANWGRRSPRARERER